MARDQASICNRLNLRTAGHVTTGENESSWAASQRSSSTTKGRREQLKRSAKRAFAEPQNWPSDVLKNMEKVAYLQYVTAEDFALGASRLSWQKYINQRLFLRR